MSGEGDPMSRKTLILAASMRDGLLHANEVGLADYVVTTPRARAHRGLTVDAITTTPAFDCLPVSVVERLKLEAAPCVLGTRRGREGGPRLRDVPRLAATAAFDHCEHCHRPLPHTEPEQRACLPVARPLPDGVQDGEEQR